LLEEGEKTALLEEEESKRTVATVKELRKEI
jgi:hypothetical protein